MNPSMKIIYSGDKHCEATHLKSNSTIVTDAPLDNNGKGEAFSPTDLTCVSLATCIITTMAIVAEKKEIPFGHIQAEIQKVMADNPRKIQEIIIHFTLSGMNWDDRQRSIMENVAHTCPVAKSLHPDVVQSIRFHYL